MSQNQNKISDTSNSSSEDKFLNEVWHKHYSGIMQKEFFLKLYALIPEEAPYQLYKTFYSPYIFQGIETLSKKQREDIWDGLNLDLAEELDHTKSLFLSNNGIIAKLFLLNPLYITSFSKEKAQLFLSDDGLQALILTKAKDLDNDLWRSPDLTPDKIRCLISKKGRISLTKNPDLLYAARRMTVGQLKAEIYTTADKKSLLAFFSAAHPRLGANCSRNVVSTQQRHIQKIIADYVLQ